MLPLNMIKSVNNLLGECQGMLSKLHADLRVVQTSENFGNCNGHYRCKHFKIQELVFPEIFNKIGEELCWRRLDSRVCWTLDALRDLYGCPIYMNNWLWGGTKKYRGLRPFDCDEGAKYSMHKYGRAADPVIKGVSHEQFINDVKTNKKEPAFQYISAVEDFDGMTWNHFATENVKKLLVFDNK